MGVCCDIKKSVLLYVEFSELYGRFLITEKCTVRAMGIRDVTEISLSEIFFICYVLENLHETRGEREGRPVAFDETRVITNAH